MIDIVVTTPITQLLPRALELATEENLQLREGLPRDLFDVMGIVNSDVTDDVRRGEVMKKISELFSVVLEHAPVDSAVDQMAKKYVSSSLPPCLTECMCVCVHVVSLLLFYSIMFTYVNNTTSDLRHIYILSFSELPLIPAFLNHKIHNIMG